MTTPNKVTSKIDAHLPDGAAAGDLWAQFRGVERITRQLTQSYKYSLGKVSRFFLELEHRRFLATRCPRCGKVYAPPRPLCPICLSVADWVELSGQGVVKTYSVLHFSPGSNDDVAALETPYILAYVLLDGADTLFPHLLKASPQQVRLGLRVAVAFSDEPVHHPIHLMYFVPVEERPSP